MRLLNATTLRLETVKPGSEPYAILSHRWADDEVLFNDIENGTAHERQGYAKLRGCCDIALSQNLKYVWIDTCCIDKSSSAELSEEINSMFRWYSMADVCYAYLHDATGDQDYLSSEWFDRGWTLQELIAPKRVEFYAKSWTKFGSRSQMSKVLSKKTGIAEAYLDGDLHGADLSRASIAERMSWAAKRVTTRPEDMAYCLLGIFNTHMSPIYGEGGEMAFIRLQRELLEKSSDHSFLAWGSPTTPEALAAAAPEATDFLSGVLARSPASFMGCGDVETWDQVVTATTTPIIMQNVGIQARLPVTTIGSRSVLLLRCHWRHDHWHVVAVPVEERSGRWYRTSPETTTYPEDQWPDNFSDKLLSQNPYVQSADIRYAIKPLPLGLRVVEVFPNDSWEEPRDTQTRIKSRGSVGSPTVTFVRLKRSAEFGRVECDYVLKLDVDGPHDRTATCQLGILTRDSPLVQADQLANAFGGFGVAVTIPGESSALAVELTTRHLHGKEAHVVGLFMDETRRKRQASCSQALLELPSKTEKDKDEHERLAQLSRESQARKERDEREKKIRETQKRIEEQKEIEERQKRVEERERRIKAEGACFGFASWFSLVGSIFWLVVGGNLQEGAVRVCWIAGYVVFIILIVLPTWACLNGSVYSEQRQEQLLEGQTGAGYSTFV